MPLEQGDVLQGIPVYSTDPDGAPAGSTPDFVLVLSRPCNALRDEQVVVATALARSLAGDNLKQIETASELKRLLAGLRDGKSYPDHFYLGDLVLASGAAPKRYFAKFDSLHSIKVPGETRARDAFIQKHRRYRLAPEFARDLHARIFGAFAALGFDDDQWFCDGDLELLVSFLQKEATQRKAEVDALASQVQVARATDAKAQEVAGLEKQLGNKRADLAKADAELSRATAEQARRRG